MKLIIDLLAIACFTSCAHAATAPTPPQEAQPVSVTIPTQGLSIQPNGDILVRGKKVANDQEVYTAFSQGIAQLQGQLQGCKAELTKLTEKAPAKKK